MNKIFIIFFTAFSLVIFYAQNAPIVGQITINHLNVTCPIFPFNVQGNFIAPSNTILDNNNIILEVRTASNPSGPVIGTVTNPVVSGTDYYFDTDLSKFTPSNGVIVDKKFVFVAKATFKEVNGSQTITVVSQINSTPDINLNGCVACNGCGSIEIILPGSCRYGGTYNSGDCEFQKEVNFSTVIGATTGTYKIYNVQATNPNRNYFGISNSGDTLPINTPSSCYISWQWDGFSTPAPTDMTADIDYIDEFSNKTTRQLYFHWQEL